MKAPIIYRTTSCYLTEEATQAIEALCKMGLDTDLAISVLEQLWAEDEIYALEDYSDEQ